MKRLLVILVACLCWLNAAPSEAVTIRLISVQEGNPQHLRAIVLIHGTFSNEGTWTGFLEWWKKPAQWELRQNYAIYAFDYNADTASTPANLTAGHFFDLLRQQPAPRSGDPGLGVPSFAFQVHGNYVDLETWTSYLSTYNKTSASAGTGTQRVDARQFPSWPRIDFPTLWGGYEQVILIGHSQGGLVAKELAQQCLASGSSIHLTAIVYLCTPHDGAAVAAWWPLTLVPDAVAAGQASTGDLGLYNALYSSARPALPPTFTATNKTLGGAGQPIALVGFPPSAADDIIQKHFGGLQFMYDLRYPNRARRYLAGTRQWSERYARVYADTRQFVVRADYDAPGVLANLWQKFKTLEGGPLAIAANFCIEGVGLTDGVVTWQSALGTKNGPGLRRTDELQVHSSDAPNAITSFTAKVPEKNFLHCQVTANVKVTDLVFPKMIAMFTNENADYQSLHVRRRSIERLYFSVLGRQPMDITQSAPSALTPDAWAHWFATASSPYDDNARYSDDEGLYSALYVVNTNGGFDEARVRAWMMNSNERRDKVAALYRQEVGGEAPAEVVNSLSLSGLDMGLVLLKIRQRTF